MTDFLNASVEYATLFPAAAMCLFPMKNKLRYSGTRVLLTGLLLISLLVPLAAALYTCTSLGVNYILFPFTALCFVFYQRSLTVHTSRSLAVFFWVMALLSIISNISVCFDSRLNRESGSGTLSFERSQMQFWFSTVAALCIWHFSSKYGTKLIDSPTANNIWYSTIPVTAMLFVLNCRICPVKYETLYVNKVFTAYITLISGMLLLLLFLTVIFYYIVISMLDMIQAENRSHIFEMQESRYIKQQRYIEESAKLRHDFKHTIRTLGELSNAGEYDALKEYLNRYIDEMPQNEAKDYCKSYPVNAVLNYYTEQAKNAGADLIMRIELPEELPFSDVDLCAMIGNILENAVTACQELPPEERSIQFTITTQNDSQLIIVSVNSFSGTVKKQGGRYLSTHRKGSGIGLDSISAAAQRCGGAASFSHDEEKKEFYIDIMLPLRNNGTLNKTLNKKGAKI